MLQDLSNARNTERNDIQIALIINALTDFNNKVNSMSRNEIIFEQPNETVNTVENILNQTIIVFVL